MPVLREEERRHEARVGAYLDPGENQSGEYRGVQVTSIISPMRERDGSGADGSWTANQRGANESDPASDRVYRELYALAEVQMRRERRSHTLQPTALVHEAYLRMLHYGDSVWADRARFGAIAATCIRRILLQHARRRNTEKGGGTYNHVTLAEAQHAQVADVDVDILALHEVLEELEKRDKGQARIIELRYFGGLTIDESARVLDMPARTLREQSRFALAWLRMRLELPDTV